MIHRVSAYKPPKKSDIAIIAVRDRFSPYALRPISICLPHQVYPKKITAIYNGEDSRTNGKVEEVKVS